MNNGYYVIDNDIGITAIIGFLVIDNANVIFIAVIVFTILWLLVSGTNMHFLSLLFFHDLQLAAIGISMRRYKEWALTKMAHDFATIHNMG